MCQIYTVSYSFYEAMLLRGVKRIVVVVFLLLILLSLRAEEAMDSAHSYHRSIGVKAAFDLNIPGKWTSTDLMLLIRVISDMAERSGWSTMS